MTQISEEKSKSCVDITVMGHCNAGRINGNDLCCCAVSMLVFTLIDSLSKLNLKNFTSGYGGGWCHIRYSTENENLEKASTVTNTVFNGFRLLAERYPSSVVIVSDNKNINERSKSNE